MTAKDDRADLAAKLIDLEKRAAELEAKLKAAAEPPEPFKSNWTRPANPTDRASMDKSVRDEIAKTFDANLVAGLHSDAHPNAYDKGGAERLPKEPQVERGSGYVEPRPLEPPPGLKLMDAMLDRQDELDRADLARRLSRSGTSKDQPK